MAGAFFGVEAQSRRFPDGKPILSERLEDGRFRHTLGDGRTVTLSAPNYRLEYLSTWIGSEPGDTYDVNVAFLGISPVSGFFEVWNFDIGELGEMRAYSFAKTVRVVHLSSGVSFTGEELMTELPASLSRR